MNSVNDYSSSDDEIGDIVSEEIRKAAEVASISLLPDKSKRMYTAAYNTSKKWRREKGSNSFCQDVLLAYILHLSENYSPPSLWATYSMLMCTINSCDQINISKYPKLIAFLKNKSDGYIPKKSEVFTAQNIPKFLNEAPDEVYLCDKVIMIFGIAGCLRRGEFVSLSFNDIVVSEDNELLVKITKTKNKVPRSFVIKDELSDVCLKYMKLRPNIFSTTKFVLKYSKGKCTQQSIAINKFGSTPKFIATYLDLSNADAYTGHSFRRTSATLLIDAGAELTELMRHGGWKSSTVATGYIADSLNNKRKICEKITQGIALKKKAVNRAVNPAVTVNHFYVSKTDVAIQTSDSLESPESKNLKKDVAIQTDSVEVEITDKKSNEVQKKLSVFYDPDLGFYIPNVINGKINIMYLSEKCDKSTNV